MPRRKQQAPRRAAAYVCDELKAAALVGEDAEPEESTADGEPAAKYACPEQEPGRACPSYQNSPAAEFSGHDMDSESHISETSDRMADFESGSVKNEEESKDAAAPPEDTGLSDSLEQMKAVYNNFLSKSYWSSLSLHLHPPPADKNGGGGGSSSSSSSSSCGSGSFDWHQSAMAKTLQQVSQGRVLPEPSLFSTVQLYRQSSKLYGSIFTGASKFRCKDCSAAYDTLVQLTVHMNETGHYRDDNQEADADNPRRWSKPRKRSLLEMEGKEDAQKVLKCMYCGHSFESLQDLSVHMIKTKHYQKVPLKEPVTPVAAKILPAARRKAPLELEPPSSPDSAGGTPKAALSDTGDLLPKAASPYITPNNRYGHQNGASYAWHFEARKSQILKCMECGSSHDSLQELTAHMMVTGHFIKVTNSAMKKGKPIMEAPVTPTVTTLLDDKVQSVPLAATTFTSPSHTPASASPKLHVEVKKEVDKEKAPSDETAKDKACEEEEKYDVPSKYHYLTESDLEESPKGGLDILKSLENTVTSAINKAQNGTPSWGGYPSIHAAYQLPNMMKLSLGSSAKSAPLKPVFSSSDILSPPKSQSLVSPPSSQTSPMPKTNFHAMEELVKKVTEKVARVEEKMKEPEGTLSPPKRATPSPCSSDVSEPSKREPPSDRGCHSQEHSPSPQREGGREGSPPAEPVANGQELAQPAPSGLSSSTAIITEHPPEQPFVNPLSALQSVMNIHLGKAAKPALPVLDPMSMLFKMSNSLAEKAAVATPPPPPSKKAEPLDRYFYHVSNDQPIDLTKGKSDKGCSVGSVLLSPTSTSAAASSSPVATAKASAVVSFVSSSPLRENALSDISDMLKNLTETHASKSSTPSSASEKSDVDGATLEEAEEATPAQKRKGRQSNWNPQHLLILQAQFAASLRQTPEGKYVMSDLSPQERMHVSRFTGLSMTTISHWLANVKYQLRRTGGTKFLKNLDTGHPVFFCNDCASQIRTPSTYISHLESHLGFRLRDLSKLSTEQLNNQIAQTKSPPEKLMTSSPEEDLGTSYQCKLCNRTFASKHAVKLHLSKTHGKSPEDHLLYVCELEKQ
nr:PREDICTED: teashirt homolog 3 [Rhinolophus sinicus]